MSETTLVAEPRTEFGKGAARRVRRAKKVPVVLYGHGTAPQHFSLPGHDLMLALKHGGANALLRLDLGDGRSELALPRAVVKDPIKGFLEHVDLLAVRRGEKVVVDVPVQLTGEAARETVVDQQATTLSVEAEATHIPDHFDVSIDGLAVGDAVHARDVQLPTGVALSGDPEGIVVHGLAASVAEPETTDADVTDSADTAAGDGGAPESTGDAADAGADS